MSARAWRRRRDKQQHVREDLRIMNKYGLGVFIRTLGEREQKRHKWLGLPPCDGKVAVVLGEGVTVKDLLSHAPHHSP